MAEIVRTETNIKDNKIYTSDLRERLFYYFLEDHSIEWSSDAAENIILELRRSLCNLEPKGYNTKKLPKNAGALHKTTGFFTEAGIKAILEAEDISDLPPKKDGSPVTLWPEDLALVQSQIRVLQENK